MPEATGTTRDRLIRAAMELFTTRGFHGTTTPLLARAAGVAEGTIYRHFVSKEALFNATWLQVHQEALAEIRETGESGGTPVAERLRQLGRRWLTAAVTDPARMRLVFGRQDAMPLDETSIQAEAAFRAGVEQVLAVGKQQGSVRAGGVELWTSIWLALVGHAVERVASREWGPAHPHAIATLDAAWEVISWRPIVPAPPVGPDSRPAPE